MDPSDEPAPAPAPAEDNTKKEKAEKLEAEKQKAKLEADAERVSDVWWDLRDVYEWCVSDVCEPALWRKVLCSGLSVVF